MTAQELKERESPNIILDHTELEEDTVYSLRCYNGRSFGSGFRACIGSEIRLLKEELYEYGVIRGFLAHPTDRDCFLIRLPGDYNYVIASFYTKDMAYVPFNKRHNPLGISFMTPEEKVQRLRAMRVGFTFDQEKEDYHGNGTRQLFKFA